MVSISPKAKRRHLEWQRYSERATKCDANLLLLSSLACNIILSFVVFFGLSGAALPSLAKFIEGRGRYISLASFDAPLASLFSPSLLSQPKNEASTAGGTKTGSGNEKRRVFVPFSTSCNPQQDWQAQAVLYTHRLHNVDTELVRLMACNDSNYELPHHSYERYRVVRTPDYVLPPDWYAPRNRPLSMTYWLTIQTEDKDLPRDDDVIIQMDADQVFLNDRVDVSMVMDGKGLAAKYDLGKAWVREWVEEFCRDEWCRNLEKGNSDVSGGAPYIFTARDTRRHVAVWSHIIDEMRKDTKHWMKRQETDMFAAVIAAVKLGIEIGDKAFMVSQPTDDGEPWHLLGWKSPIASSTGEYPGLFLAHYCQRYKMEGDISWYKYDFFNIDIRKCDQESTISHFLDTVEPTLIEEKKKMFLGVPDGHVVLTEDLHMARSLWMYENAVRPVHASVESYYKEFCSNVRRLRRR